VKLKLINTAKKQQKKKNKEKTASKCRLHASNVPILFSMMAVAFQLLPF